MRADHDGRTVSLDPVNDRVDEARRVMGHVGHEARRVAPARGERRSAAARERADHYSRGAKRANANEALSLLRIENEGVEGGGARRAVRRRWLNAQGAHVALAPRVRSAT